MSLPWTATSELVLPCIQKQNMEGHHPIQGKNATIDLSLALGPCKCGSTPVARDRCDKLVAHGYVPIESDSPSVDQEKFCFEDRELLVIFVLSKLKAVVSTPRRA